MSREYYSCCCCCYCSKSYSIKTQINAHIFAQFNSLNLIKSNIRGCKFSSKANLSNADFTVFVHSLMLFYCYPRCSYLFLFPFNLIGTKPQNIYTNVIYFHFSSKISRMLYVCPNCAILDLEHICFHSILPKFQVYYSFRSFISSVCIDGISIAFYCANSSLNQEIILVYLYILSTE